MESIRGARASFNSRLSGNALSGQSASPSDPLGWARNITTKDQANRALRSPEAFSDIAEYYRERDGVSFSTHQEAVDYFMSDRRWRNMNSVSMGRDIYDANSQGDIQVQRLARLQTLFDQLPNFYEEGGSGGAGLAENIAASVLDPVNLIGFGAGGAAAKGAVATARAGASQLGRREATRIGLRAGVRAGAVGEAATSGVTEAGFDAAMQARNVDIGIQDETSLAQTALSGAVGAVTGGVLGAGFGAAGAVLPNPLNRTTALTPGGRTGALGAPVGNAQNAIQQGLFQGVAARRTVNAKARAAETAAQAAARGLTDPATDGGEAALIQEMETVLSQLEDPDFDTTAQEASVDQQFPPQIAAGDQQPFGTTPAPITPAQRLRQQLSAYNNLRAQAEQFRQRAAQISSEGTGAPISGNADRAIQTIQTNARAYADAADAAERHARDISRRFAAIKNGDADIETPDTSAEAAVAASERILSIDSNQVDAVRQITYDPTAPSATGQLPDGSPMRALTPDELETNRRRDAAIMPRSLGERQEIRPTETVGARAAASTADDPAAEASTETAAPVREVDNRDSIGVLQSEADTLDQEVATLSNQIKGLKNRATRQRKQGNEQAAVDLDREIVELDTRRQEASASRDQKRAEAADIEARFAQRYAVPEAPQAEVTPEAVANTTPTAQGARVVDDPADAVEVEPAVTADEALARTLGEAFNTIDQLLARGGSGSVETQVEFLTSLGYDADEMRVALRSLGDGRSRAGRESRAEFMRQAVRKAVVEVYVSDAIDGVAEADPAMVFHAERMLATIGAFPEAIQDEAVDTYFAFVRQSILDGLLVERLEANGFSVSSTIDEVSSVYGDQIGRIAAEVLGVSDGGMVQFAELPSKALDDVLRELPADLAASLRATQEQMLAALMGNGTISPDRAADIARRITLERAEAAARRAGNSFQANNRLIDENVSRLRAAQGDLRIARDEMNGVYSTKRSQKGTVTRSEKVVYDSEVRASIRALLAGRNEQDLRGAERVKLLTLREQLDASRKTIYQYVFEAGEGATEAEAIASAARARKAEIYAAHALPADTTIGTAIEMLEKRVARLESQRGRAQTTGVNQGTRTSRDISVSEAQGGNASFMGRTQRQGFGSYTQNGKLVEGGAPSSIQSVLRRSKSTGYTGKLMRTRNAVQADGQTVRESAIVTSLLEMLEAQRKRASAKRMTADDIKRQRSIDTFTADTTGRAFDVQGAEAALDAVQRTKRGLRAAERKGKGVEAARAKYEDAVQQARLDGFVTQDEIDSEGGDVGAALRWKIAPFTRSTQQEAAANVEEETRAALAEAIRTKELAARAVRIQNQMRRLLNGRRASDLQGAELAEFQRLREESQAVSSEMASAVRSIEATERAAMQPMKQALRAERIARRNAMAENIIQSRLSDGDVAVMSEEDWSRYFGTPISPEEFAEDIAAANKAADIQMRLAAEERKGNETINRAALEGRTNADLREMVRALQRELDAIKAGRPAPVAPPASAKRTPYIRKVDGIEVDVNNDFQFVKGGAGTSVRFDGVELGIIKRLDGDAGITFEKVVDANPNVSRDIRLFQDANQVRDFIAREYIGRIKEVQARTQQFDETPGERGFEYTVPWTESETYAGEAPRNYVEDEAADPITEPMVLGRDDDMMSQTADNFDVPPGKQLAIQFVDPNFKTYGSIRVPQGKQTIGAVLGKSSSHQFVVGYVDALSKSGSTAALRSFRPLDPEAAFLPFGSKEPVRGADYASAPGAARKAAEAPRTRANRPVSLDHLSKKPIAAGVEFQNPVPSYGIRLASMRSLADLHNYALRLDNLAWDRINTPQDFDVFMAHRAEVAQMLNRFLPHGVQKIDQTMRSAEGQLRSILAERAPEEIESAIGLLMRVSGMDGRRVPLFTTGTGRPAYAPAAAPTAVERTGRRVTGRTYPGSQINDENVGRIIIGDDTFNEVEGGQKYLPVTATLAHEIGHWIYQNLLDESDKMAFWQGMRKYVGETGVDYMSLKRGSPNVFDNELTTPAEFFANQFMAWVMKANHVDMSIWQKVAKMAVALLRRIVRGEEDFAIDPDLVSIFQRHLPPLEVDGETGLVRVGVSRFAALPEFGRLHGKPATSPDAVMNRAEFKGRQLVQLDEQRVKLASALQVGVTNGDSLRLSATLDEVSRKLYGLYGGRSGEAKHKTIEGREESTGFSRMWSADNTPTRRMVLKAQGEIRAFIAQLRDAGFDANRSAAANARGALLPENLETGAVAAIYDTIERQLGDPDIGSFFEGDAAAASALRNAGLEGLQSEATDHLRRLGRAMLNAVDADIRFHLREFNKALPRSAKGAGVIIRDDGTAYASRGNIKSERFKRMSRAALAEERAAFEAAQSVVDTLNSAGMRDILAELSDEQLVNISREAGVSPKKMATPEIVTAIRETENPLRAAELANEMRMRAAPKPATTPDQLDEGAQKILAYARESLANAQNALNKAVESGDARMIDMLAAAVRDFGIENPISVTSPKVSRAIETAASLETGVLDEDGLDASLPSSLRDYANLITHRDPRVKDKIARVFTNMIWHLYSDAELTGAESIMLTPYDAAKMIGLPGGDALPDDVPLRTDSDLYNQLRNSMRGLAAAIQKGNTDDAVEAVAKFNFELLAPSERAVFSSAAEKMGMSGRELHNGLVRNALRGSVSMADLRAKKDGEALVRLLKESTDRVAHIMSGVRAPDANDGFVMLAGYGDVYENLRNRTPASNAAFSVSSRAIHPTISNRVAKEVVSGMTRTTEDGARRFLGVAQDADLMRHVYHVEVPNAEVDGITATRGGEYGDGVYLRRKPDEGYDAMGYKAELEDIVAREASSADAARAGLEAVREVVSLRELLSTEMARGADAASIQSILKSIKVSWSIIKAVAPSANSRDVFPAFARVRNGFDISSNSTFSLAPGRSNIDHILTDMVQRGMLTARGLDQLRNSLTARFTGRDLYEALTSDVGGLMHTNGDAVDGPNARNRLAEYLRSKGYDSLVTDEGLVAFDTAQVRGVRDGFRDFVASEERPATYTGKTSVEVMTEMSFTQKAIEKGAAVSVTVDLQNAGVPEAVIKPIRRMLRGQDLKPADVDRVAEFSSVRNFFSENSSRLRKMGANWFADIIKPINGTGVYEAHAAEMGRVMGSLLNGARRGDPALLELPDARGYVSRWVRRNKFYGEVAQPASHRRILDAIRSGRGAVAALKADERAVAFKIIKSFEDELVRMRDLGIPVGDARRGGTDFYVPQLWDIEAIRDNPGRFVDAMARVFAREQNMPDFDGAREGMDSIRERAERMVDRMLATDGDFVNSVDGARSVLSDPFYQRAIRLQPGDYPEVDSFLVNDLEGLLVKYFDRTVRKRILSERVGVNGHGLLAYERVAEGGVEAAADVLMSQRMAATAERNTRAGYAAVEQVIVPRIEMSRESLIASLKEVRRLLGEGAAAGDKDRARNIILNMQSPEFRNDRQFAVRVDAIVNALADFNKRPITGMALNEINGMNNVLNRRPIEGNGTGMAHQVTRRLKAFNAVTLLGFTTLTSLPDVSISLIRSGNFGAFASAWKRYSTDPDYRRSARNIGVGIDNLLHQKMAEIGGEGSQRFSNSFFNFTLLTPWTNVQREVAAMVGYEAARAELARAVRLRREGKSSSRAFQTSYRFLERYGFTGANANYDFLAPNAVALDLAEADPKAAQALRVGIMRFTNEAIFMPNPNDIPQWAQTPWGSVVFQLKSYPLMMMRLAKHAFEEAAKGNAKPIAYMATAGAGFGALSLAVKDIVQSRGGEDERSRDVRDRRVSEMFPALAEAIGVEPGEDADAAIGWYMQSMLAMGGLGLFGDFFFNVAEQADNGAYGQVRLMSYVLGPSAGLIAAGGDIVGGANQFVFGEEGETGRTRQALRTIAARVPAAGGIADFREGVADLGGPPRGERNTTFRGGSFGNGFGGGFDDSF